jgi:hypothetical protein
MPWDPEGKYQQPPHQLATWVALGAVFVLVLGLLAVRLPNQPETSRAYASRSLPSEPPPLLLPAPEMSDGYFPCSDCHEDEPVNREVRVLEEDHEEMDFQHGHLWCLHCHDADDSDRLRLSDETLIEFEESWRLCTQCHAKKLAEWRMGVHGKRTGYWWGPKEYRTCVNCHNPHRPPFQPLEPLPPPWRPEQIARPVLAELEVPDEEH